MKAEVMEFLDLVADAKDRLTGLANDLDANSHQVEWSIGDEGDEHIEYFCRVQCTFGLFNYYHASSYVSLIHPFEKAEADIKKAHASWLANNDGYERKREEDEIKQRLYDDYMKQNFGIEK